MGSRAGGPDPHLQDKPANPGVTRGLYRDSASGGAMTPRAPTSCSPDFHVPLVFTDDSNGNFLAAALNPNKVGWPPKSRRRLFCVFPRPMDCSKWGTHLVRFRLLARATTTLDRAIRRLHDLPCADGPALMVDRSERRPNTTPDRRRSPSGFVVGFFYLAGVRNLLARPD